MIVRNGRLRFAAVQGGALDPATGFPLAGEAAWDAGVPCQYVAGSMNNLGVVLGERHRLATWEMYIDMPCAERRGLCRVEDEAGRPVAEGEIVSWEPLEAVRQVRVTM